jgi:predicted dehydrogenase
MSGLPLYRRALKQPENVKRVLSMVREQGLVKTIDRVRGKLSAGTPTGYSAAGEVVETGAEVEGFGLGDRVACAGAGIANHAEYIEVPVNLAVKIPDGLDSRAASTVTLGAIALQGIRRANPTLGETVLVVGLGILGQLTAQMLQANGCRVIGVDLDAARMRRALDCGMSIGIDPTREDYVAAVQRWTGGYGADAAIVTAATPSHEVISQAMQACRKKGRVVLVGDVGLNLARQDMYAKELDFLISCSYGPGRYDPVFEEKGQDYPLPYVRWTETRNMETYLHLVADGRVKLEPLIDAVFPVEEAQSAYAALEHGENRPLVVILQYAIGEAHIERTVRLPRARSRESTIRVGLAGAGSFATAMHLPNMAKLSGQFTVRAVMSRTGSNAKAIAQQSGADYATTEYEDLLSDPDIDLVLVATRHNLHASMVVAALEAGKHVFVEKPLCITADELDRIAAFFKARGEAPVLMTGFNRRFSPAMGFARQVFARRATPMLIDYRMNAGYIPPDHWVHGEEGGGRNIGEACHIYDLFIALTGGGVRSVSAHAVRPASPQWRKNDNFVATVAFQDGSVCNLLYSALGHGEHPKEQMEIFCDGKVLSMNDYRSVNLAGASRPGWKAQASQKGQFEELVELGKCLREGAPWPIPLEQQIEATRISLEVERIIFASKDCEG